jgi:glycosyltransferase involved in cell wall biosynthesis
MTPEHVTCVALITNDAIGAKMAGPGIRYWELAGALARQGHTVHLIVPPFVPLEDVLPSDAAFATHAPRTATALRALLMECDVLVTLGIVLAHYPFLTTLQIPLVIDLYDPFLLSGLQRTAADPFPRQVEANQQYLAALQIQLRMGDFFLCAAEKQRDYWLGMLSALGRLNPYTYKRDPTFRQLIDVLPFGIPAQHPAHTQAVLKGVYPGIDAEDKVLLWGGGIWNWFDAPTLIRALPLILRQRTDVKLFFMGTQRPNQSVSKMDAVDEAIELSRSLGLYGTHVFFNDWTPYELRQNFLLEADIGVSLHLDYVETRFAFRTRLLDYLWAGLPIVATAGDILGEDLTAQGVATLVPPQDPAAVAACVLDLLATDEVSRAARASRARAIAGRYHWDAIVQPLADFCRAPCFAADREYIRQFPLGIEERGPGQWVHKIRQALQAGGLRELWRQVFAYLHWRRQQ